MFSKIQRTLLHNSGLFNPQDGNEKQEASSSCTPIFFFLHPHYFLNPKTGLNLLFEKGHRGYQN